MLHKVSCRAVARHVVTSSGPSVGGPAGGSGRFGECIVRNYSLVFYLRVGSRGPLGVMCGRRLIDKSFLTLMQHWSGAVMCPAC